MSLILLTCDIGHLENCFQGLFLLKLNVSFGTLNCHWMSSISEDNLKARSIYSPMNVKTNIDVEMFKSVVLNILTKINDNFHGLWYKLTNVNSSLDSQFQGQYLLGLSCLTLRSISPCFQFIRKLYLTFR